jgi:AraC-like DNA-binding protein
MPSKQSQASCTTLTIKTIVFPLPFDPEPRVYGPQKIIALAKTLEQDGVDLVKILDGTGLDESALHSPYLRVSYAQIATVFRNAVLLARDPATALYAGQNMRLTSYGTYGYALLSSPEIDERIDFATKYQGAVGPVAGFIVTRKDDVDICRYESFLSTDPDSDLYRFALEFSFSADLILKRDLYGDSFAFSALRAVYPEPSCLEAYRQLFRCPLYFNQDANELEIGGIWKNRSPQLPDPVTYTAAREICQQFLADLPHAGGTASIVRRMLFEQLPSRFPNIESMSQALSMHPRTLRRKLEAQGTSYRQIVAEVRKTLAVNYLRTTRMSIAEIANRLGYSDATNFYHAFASWTGKTPSEYR